MADQDDDLREHEHADLAHLILGSAERSRREAGRFLGGTDRHRDALEGAAWLLGVAQVHASLAAAEAAPAARVTNLTVKLPDVEPYSEPEQVDARKLAERMGSAITEARDRADAEVKRYRQWVDTITRDVLTHYARRRPGHNLNGLPIGLLAVNDVRSAHGLPDLGPEDVRR